MARVSLGPLGIVLLLMMGLVQTIQLTVGNELKNASWPFFRIVAIAVSFLCIICVVWCAITKTPVPPVRLWIWVFLRGAFGLGSFLFIFLAVFVGTSPGDVASLTSINTVFSAFLGFIFLRERVLLVHMFAVLCCVGGAVLVSQPDFIFGSDTDSGAPWHGYLFAISAGFTDAGLAIAARKTGTTSVWWLIFSTCALSVAALPLLSLTPVLEDFTLEPIAEEPAKACGFVALVFCLSSFCIFAASAGAQWCPAAVSTTVTTAGGMLWGYVAQVVFFGNPLQAITLVGAVLMLLGVAIMAFARAPAKPPQPAAATASEDMESLASFMAAEFSQHSAHQGLAGVSASQKGAAEHDESGAAPCEEADAVSSACFESKQASSTSI